MGFFDVLGSVVTGGLGGIVGAAGAIGGKIIDLKMEGEKRETLKLTMAHELELRDKDMAQTRLEAESKMEVARVDADAAAVQGDLANLGKAIDAEMSAKPEGTGAAAAVVEFARGTVRPALTAWASLLVSYVTWQAFVELKGVPLGPDRSLALVNDAMFLAGLAIAYWFGSRPNRSK